MRRLSAHKKTHSLVSSIDHYLLAAVGVLVFFGLIMVYDAAVVQAFKDHNDKYYYIKQQLIWMVLGIGTLTFFSYFNYQNLRKLALPLLILSIILLLAVSLPGLGISAGGAHRWLRIGPFTIQPAEIIKLSCIIFFATLFEKKVRTAPFLMLTLFVIGVLGILQRDLGSAGVYFLTMLTLYIYAGGPLKYFMYLLPISAAGLLAFILMFGYRVNRVKAVLNPFADPQGYTYHISQVLIAIGSGGIFGLGIGQSRQKFEYIPEVTTDSIFAIVGEELGLVGSLFLISLFVFLIYRGFKISEKINDPFGKLLSFGLITWIAVQALINIGAMVSLIPLTGVPLPFISYGGSALLANLMAIGILLNISKHRTAN